MSAAALRYFKSREDAERALIAIKEFGFDGQIVEDTFLGYPLIEFKVPRRFKLMVNREDYFKIAQALAKKMQKKT